MERDLITLSMGSGGKDSARLVEEVFLPILGNPALNRLDDAAELEPCGSARLAFSTDSYTVKPIFFPGGDIGSLSVCGTMNDLSVKGAKPLALSAAFIIEEGFSIPVLKRVAESMQKTAALHSVDIVTADTKVVGRGEADGLFINTAGIGIIRDGMNVSSSGARPGDAVIVSGTIGEHGVSILNAREKLGFRPEPRSDVAPVCDITAAIAGIGRGIHVMRDPTRGGVSSALGEIAAASGVSIRLFERKIPVSRVVRACCDLLGLDPLHLAGEGRGLVIVEPGASAQALRKIRSLPEGKKAEIIGEVEEPLPGADMPRLLLQTALGPARFIAMPEGEPVPRIC